MIAHIYEAQCLFIVRLEFAILLASSMLFAYGAFEKKVERACLCWYKQYQEFIFRNVCIVQTKQKEGKSDLRSYYTKFALFSIFNENLCLNGTDNKFVCGLYAIQMHRIFMIVKLCKTEVERSVSLSLSHQKCSQFLLSKFLRQISIEKCSRLSCIE